LSASDGESPILADDARVARTRVSSRRRSSCAGVISRLPDESLKPDDALPAHPPPGPLRGPTSPSRGEVKNACCSSRAQPPGESREIQRAEAIMREPAHVRFEEGAQVRHAVFEHGDAVDPHAPGKAL